MLLAGKELKLLKEFYGEICKLQIFLLKIKTLYAAMLNLTLVLLNPDIPCLCKQCRSEEAN